MKIVVHDTAIALLDLLGRPPAERPGALRELLDPLRDALAVAGDPDLVAMHRSGGGFPLDHDDPRCAAAVEEMVAAGVWGRVEERLTAARDRLGAALPGARTADTVHVVIVPGDPDDELLTVRSAGYFGLGGFPGAVLLTVRPTGTSLAAIGHAAAHELHHNVRYANVFWNPGTVTAGERVVAEGLAEAFVRELAGEAAPGPRAPRLTGPEPDQAHRRVPEAVDTAGTANPPPYVFGDHTAQRLGYEPVGLPGPAGYAAGLRIVDAHLAATGLTAAESTVLPVGEILANAAAASRA
ncbi:DUF2268 domain-containing protein [Streptomyces sp. NPDC003691]